MAMAKKAKEQMDHAGKKTRFEGRDNDGQFHEILREKFRCVQKSALGQGQP